MQKEPIVVNKKISNPQKALEVFQLLDLERIQDSGLSSEVVFYLGRDFGGRKTEKYKGTIYTEPDETGGLIRYPSERIYLPTPIEFEWGLDHNNPKKDKVTLQTKLEGARWIEFMITAKTSEDYMGLDALRNVVIPEFFKKGYDQGNIEHTSIFWLHLGKEKPKDYVLDISPSGLHVTKSGVDGIKVFTEKDLNEFRKLS